MLKTESVRVFKRALVLGECDRGKSQIDIEKMGYYSIRTVRNIFRRYEEGGLSQALYDRSRSGQPRKYCKKQEEKIAAIACTNPPVGQSRWTLNLIKEASEQSKIVESISREALRIILASREIKPWKHKMWCIPSIDDEFIRCMEDVLEIYERKFDPKEPVICIDEKPVQLLDSLRPDIRAKFIKQDYEYKRLGMVNAFCGIEPKAGRHFIMVRKRKTMKDFAMFVRKIVRSYPNARKIHLVMDNLNTHTENALIQTFGTSIGRKLWRKIVPHYTPKHASWLNQAEIEIGMFNRQCIGKIRVRNIDVGNNIKARIM